MAARRAAVALSMCSAAAAGGVVVAATPPMGFNTYNRFGCRVTADILKRMADGMVSSGLRDAGYRYVNSDDGWAGSRSANGTLLANPSRFPDGVGAVADYIHAKGLKLGIYTSAGPKTCDHLPASCNFERGDARLFAEWGVDYVKDDACGSCRADRIDDYAAMQAGISAAGRPMVLVVEGTPPFPAVADGAHGNGRRVGHDIRATWVSVTSLVDQAAGLWRYAHNGSAGGGGWWNDLDIMEVGNGAFNPGRGAAAAAMARAHMTYWCIMKAVLLLGNDLSKIPNATLAVVADPDAISVNQDPLGVAGRRVASTPPDNLTLVDSGDDAVVALARCDPAAPTQRWRHNASTGALWTTDAGGREWRLGANMWQSETNARGCSDAARCAKPDWQGWSVVPVAGSAGNVTLSHSGKRLSFNNGHGASGPLPHTRWLQRVGLPTSGSGGSWAYDPLAASGSTVRPAGSLVTDDDQVGGVAEGRAGSGYCLDVVRNGNTEVWHAPLAGGRHAVAVFARGPHAAAASVEAAALGAAAGARFAVRDVWARRDLPPAEGPYRATAPAHGAALLILTPA